MDIFLQIVLGALGAGVLLLAARGLIGLLGTVAAKTENTIDDRAYEFVKQNETLILEWVKKGEDKLVETLQKKLDEENGAQNNDGNQQG